jgi:hypothetical protein
MGRLFTPKVTSNLRSKDGIDLLTEIFSQKNIFSGNRNIGFEFEHEMTVWPLDGKKRLGRLRDALLDIAQARFV